MNYNMATNCLPPVVVRAHVLAYTRLSMRGALSTARISTSHRHLSPAALCVANQITYEPFEDALNGASMRERCWTLAWAAVSLGLVITAAES